MGVIANMLGRGKVEDRSLSRENVPAVFFGDAGEGPVIGPRQALAISDVLARVRCLSDSASALPLQAFRRLPGGGRERFTGRLSDLLAQPAPGSTTCNLVGTIMCHLNLYGNAYVGKYRDSRGTVTQLAPLNPANVTVEVKGGEPRFTIVGADGVAAHTSADVLHVRGLSLDGVTGLSPIAQARAALGLAQALSGHAEAFSRNAGRPGGILSVKNYRPAADGEDDLLEATKTKFSERFTLDRSGGVMVLAGDGVDFQQLSLSLVDSQFIEQRQLSTAEIARVFRVPPFMIGAPSGDSMTYSNTESQALAFLKFSLQPWLTAIEGSSLDRVGSALSVSRPGSAGCAGCVMSISSSRRSGSPSRGA